MAQAIPAITTIGSAMGGTAGTLGMAAGAGAAVPLAASTAAGTGVGLGSLANSAASAGSSGLFNTVLGLGKDIAKDSLSSAVKSNVTGELNKALNPTSTPSPMIGTAQAPTELGNAAAQNRPQATAGSFQANVGPGYQVGDAQLAKISGLSDEEAEILRRIASGNSGLSSLMG